MRLACLGKVHTQIQHRQDLSSQGSNPAQRGRGQRDRREAGHGQHLAHHAGGQGAAQAAQVEEDHIQAGRRRHDHPTIGATRLRMNLQRRSRNNTWVTSYEPILDSWMMSRTVFLPLTISSMAASSRSSRWSSNDAILSSLRTKTMSKLSIS